MSRNLTDIRRAVVISAFLLLVNGCSELKWQVLGPLDEQSSTVGPLRIEALPVDTAALDHNHPFHWHHSRTAGFLVFDVRITNTGREDLPCQVGHFDFPGLASVQPVLTNAGETQVRLARAPELDGLVTAGDLRLATVAHELATILMADGQRYQVLGYADFFHKYSYLMQRDVARAHAISTLGYAPYTFGIPRLVSSVARRSAEKHMPERLISAQQRVMRPGIVAAGATVRGYLVFDYPQHAEPGAMTLRLPVQPGHAASIRFDLVPRS